MSTHTRGPWQAIATEFEGGAKGFVILAQPGVAMRGFTTQVAYMLGHEANARLIAAAPDLLAALKSCVESLSVNHPGDNEYWAALELAEAAITKAEGK
jgi:hypothetical protein